MEKILCRCGGKTELKHKNENHSGVLIKDVPVLVCKKCGEEWYPPGIPRMIEGIREAVLSIDHIKVLARKSDVHAAT